MTTALTPRPYQAGAREALDDAERRGCQSALVALPTGTGKTVVFSEWINEPEPDALILAHRDELLKQAAEKLELVAPELAMSIGYVKAEQNEVDKPIVIGSVATLASPHRLEQLRRGFRKVVVDEAHHATAASYRRILEYVEAGMVAGFTATPERHDDSSLKDVFEEIVYARSLLQMIEEGYLCDLRGLRVELEDLDLSTVKVSRGEYQADDLERALHEAHAPEHTAAALVEHASNRKSIVFVPTVALAKETAATIREAGLSADYVIGDNSKAGLEHRHRVLHELREGDLDAVVNVDVLSEGFDCPSVDCVVMAAPTRSRICYVQRVGRVTRIYPGKEDGLILDLVGVTDELSLQSLPDLFALEGPIEAGETVTSAVAREEKEREARATAEDDQRRAEALERKRKAREASLFGRERLHWLDLGDRWALPVDQGEHLVLDPAGDGHFQVILLKKDRARILARGLDLGYAMGAAEETMRLRGAESIADREAGWRKGRPNQGQLQYLRRLRVAEQPKTKGEAADLIDAAIVRQRLKKLDAALSARAAV